MNAPPRPLAPGARTQEWGRFLGPHGDGRCDEAPIRTTFGPGGPPKVWETPKGEGYASPAVVGGRVLLFHRLGGRETLTCLSAESGRVLWNQGHSVGYQDRYGYDGGPRCQPVGDARRVATLGVAGALTGWDVGSGTVLWRRDLLREFGGGTGFFGVGATPWVDGERLFVAASAKDGGRLLSLDLDTGKTRWETPTPWGAGYAALVIGRAHGRRFLYAFLGGDNRPPTGGLLCVDPDSGRILGTFPWRARRYESVNASAPLPIGNQVLITECYGAGTALCDVSPEGALAARWTTRAYGAHFMTPAVREGHLYLVDGHGPYNAPLVCADLATGAVRWRAEPEWPLVVKEGTRTVTVPRMPARASLISFPDGRCLALGEYGHLAWLELNAKAYRERERVQVFAAENSWSPPVVSRGLLYLCQNTDGYDGSQARLHCLDLRGTVAPARTP